jgi:hypothetical protein
MRLYEDFDIETFDAWSGGTDTKNAIIEAGKAAKFNALVDDIFPDGCDTTAMNDFLWFDSASIYEMLGLNEDGEEPEEDPADEEAGEMTNPADYSTFDEFCQDCECCPYDAVCKTQEECKKRFEELKGGAA